jgi:hypothetical protein
MNEKGNNIHGPIGIAGVQFTDAISYKSREIDVSTSVAIE